MSNALPPEQPCTDPRHTGAIREQLGCTGPAPVRDRVMAAIRAEYVRRIEMQIVGSPEEHIAAFTDAAVTVLPAEHCGHQPPHAISGYGLLTECVLRPGHSGSHADERGMRWWLATSSPAETEAGAAIERVRAYATHLFKNGNTRNAQVGLRVLALIADQPEHTLIDARGELREPLDETPAESAPLVHQATEQQATAPAPVDESALDQPQQPTEDKARQLPCSLGLVRNGHAPHWWQPQPGMADLLCPGRPRTDAATQPQTTTA